MVELIQSPFAHMAWADTAILKAVAAQDGAFADDELQMAASYCHRTVVFPISVAAACL